MDTPRGNLVLSGEQSHYRQLPNDHALLPFQPSEKLVTLFEPAEAAGTPLPPPPPAAPPEAPQEPPLEGIAGEILGPNRVPILSLFRWGEDGATQHEG